MHELITSGKTVEEAIENALNQLGLSEDEVTVDVIQLPQKKLFKSIPAKVKVTVDASEKQSAKEQAPKIKAQKQETTNDTKTAKNAKVQSAPENAQKKQETPSQDKKDKNKLYDEDYKQEDVDIESVEILKNAREYLIDICGKMGASDLSFEAVKRGDSYIIKIEGENAGFLIGYRGETMDSLGYLTSLYVNRSGDDYSRINIDVNSYRAKREANLVALAHKISSKVLQTKRSKTLEPMNPYERRILHSVVMDIKGVKSESTGEGTQRRVCIMPEGESIRKGDNRGKGQRQRQGNYNNKSQTPARNFANKKPGDNAQPTAPKRTQTINDSDALPLYGKIEL